MYIIHPIREIDAEHCIPTDNTKQILNSDNIIVNTDLHATNSIKLFKNTYYYSQSSIIRLVCCRSSYLRPIRNLILYPCVSIFVTCTCSTIIGQLNFLTMAFYDLVHDAFSQTLCLNPPESNIPRQSSYYPFIYSTNPFVKSFCLSNFKHLSITPHFLFILCIIYV